MAVTPPPPPGVIPFQGRTASQFLVIHWTGLCKEHVCRINFLSRNYYYTTYVCVWLCVTKEILVLYHNDIDDKFSYCF